MIYWLYTLLQEDYESLVRLFRYVSSRGMGAAVLSFFLTVILGQYVIRKLLSLKIGQPIRTADEVHKLYELHGKKQGTPTMGGLLILSTVLVSTLVWARLDNPYIWLCMLVTLVLGTLGFVDDFKKVTQANSDGISARAKLIVQLVLAVIVTFVLVNIEPSGHEGKMTTLYIPFTNVETTPLKFQLGWFAVILISAVIIGCSNAVNLTDGLDGLAIGCTITTSAAFAIFSYLAGHREFANYLFIPHHPWSSEVFVFCLAIVGAGLGFLWFNSFPASVFMGDTGSLAIGGMLGMAAIGCRQEILLVIVGGVFVMEAMSVMLQVGSYKLRGGKRIFRMAPIHHHFELIGWTENKIIVRFWILSLIFAGIGLASLKLRV